MSYTTAPPELIGTAEVSWSNPYCPSLQVGCSNAGSSVGDFLESSLLVTELRIDVFAQ